MVVSGVSILRRATFEGFGRTRAIAIDYVDIKQDLVGECGLAADSGLQYYEPETNHFTIYKHDPIGSPEFK